MHHPKIQKIPEGDFYFFSPAVLFFSDRTHRRGEGGVSGFGEQNWGPVVRLTTTEQYSHNNHFAT